jgi:hypothetical protein
VRKPWLVGQQVICDSVVAKHRCQDGSIPASRTGPAKEGLADRKRRLAVVDRHVLQGALLLLEVEARDPEAHFDHEHGHEQRYERRENGCDRGTA